MGWGTIAAAVGGGLIDAVSQSSANATNRRLAREQMAFQERMSSSEIQRRVADLSAAGMNPMLAGVNQSGASSAQGASTRVEPITRNTASTAMAVATQRANLQNIAEQTRLLQQQQANVRADTNLKEGTAVQTAANVQKVDAEIQRMAIDFKRAQAEYDISEEQLKEKRLTNAQLEKMQPLLEAYQRMVNDATRLGMTQRELDERFARELGEESKYIRFIQQLFGPPRTDITRPTQ